jgi:hypothetical protein
LIQLDPRPLVTGTAALLRAKCGETMANAFLNVISPFIVNDALTRTKRQPGFFTKATLYADFGAVFQRFFPNQHRQLEDNDLRFLSETDSLDLAIDQKCLKFGHLRTVAVFLKQKSEKRNHPAKKYCRVWFFRNCFPNTAQNLPINGLRRPRLPDSPASTDRRDRCRNP